jgi:hypothetical protein
MTAEASMMLARKNYTPGCDLYLADVPGGDDQTKVKEASAAILQVLSEDSKMHVNVSRVCV